MTSTLNINVGDREYRKFGVDPAGNTFLKANSVPPLKVLFDPDSTTPTYIGLNFTAYNASTAGTDWVVLKFTSTSVQRRENIAWDDRVASF
jgi:hypothetical protein